MQLQKLLSVIEIIPFKPGAMKAFIHLTQDRNQTGAQFAQSETVHQRCLQNIFQNVNKVLMYAMARYLQVCHTCEELFSLSDEPKVVLASMPSLECGLCSELLVKWAEDSRNMIIMTSHPQVCLPG